MITKFRVSRRSEQDAGEAGNGTNNAPMDLPMEMVTAVTSIAAENTGGSTFDSMGINENSK